ncbi:MAG: GNAT family N-acetyltransferase [Gammaproteobacteria bacterium]|nr:GNAT family N-acetyltransferase [Gammaproteobacteria bacterium]
MSTNSNSAHFAHPTREGYTLTFDKCALDITAIHAYLSKSYWSTDIPRATVQRAIDNSLCAGVFYQAAQIGFARVVTDKATFAYLCDVYILDAHRGLGLSKWLLKTIQSRPELQGLRRFIFGTRDAHGLYAQFGFTPLSNPSRMMEILLPTIYETAKS